MNLKQAARTLGIHYQTAYKLVRSGRLAAVRVGGSYEISDAAIERYLTEREAMRRAPASAPTPVRPIGGIDTFFSALRAALDATGPTARPVLEIAAEGLAEHLGDLAIARPASRDRDWLLPGVARHTDARRRTLAAAAVEMHPEPVGTHAMHALMKTRAPVHVPHVPQDQLRAWVRPERTQYLDEVGVHSLVAAPALWCGEVVGVVVVTRDAPGNPYTTDDVALVARVADVVGAAIARAQLVAEAWRRRRTLMAGVADAVEQGRPPAEVAPMLRDGAVAELVCDGETNVVAVNATAATMGGVARHQLLGRDLVGLAAPDERVAEKELLRRLLVGELRYADTTRAVTTSHGTRTIAAHHGVVHDERARPVALVVVAHELPEPPSWAERLPADLVEAV